MRSVHQLKQSGKGMDKKTDVWIINQYAILPTQSGGTRHYSFAKHFDINTFRVKIIAGQSGYGVNNKQSQNNRVLLDNVEFILIRDFIVRKRRPGRLESTILYNLGLLLYFCKSFPWKFKPIIIGSSPNLLTAFVAYILSRLFKLKYILEIRDIWPKSIIELTGMREDQLIIRVMKIMEKHLYNNSDHIVSLLEGFKLHRDDTTKITKDVTWIPNGYDISSIKINEEPKRNNNEFIVCYAGSHGIANNLIDLIDAAKLISMSEHVNIKIFLIGDGILKRELQDKAVSMGLKNVIFEDAVAKKYLRERISRADAFVLPGIPSSIYKYGVSPNKLFDYFSMKKPIIFAIGTPFDPVTSSQSGLSVQPGDPQALANAIIQLSNIDIEERRRMGENGYRYLQENHDIRQLSNRYQKIILSLNNGKRG